MCPKQEKEKLGEEEKEKLHRFDLYHMIDLRNMLDKEVIQILEI